MYIAFISSSVVAAAACALSQGDEPVAESEHALDDPPAVFDDADGGPTREIDGAYGSGFGADTAANIALKPGVRLAYRFRASQTAAITRLRFENRVTMATDTAKNPPRFYSEGDGGRIHVELHADDGTLEHRPGELLARTESYVPNPNGKVPADTVRRMPILPLDHPVPARAGEYFHIVFVQESTDPKRWASINMMMVARANNAPAGPLFGDTLAVHVRYGDSGWGVARSSSHVAAYIPMFDVFYDDESTDGQGYFYARARDAETPVAGGQRVRERFRVRGSDRRATALWLRLYRTGTSGHPLGVVVRRLGKDESALAEVRVDESAVPLVTTYIRGNPDAPVDWIKVPLDGGDREIVLRSGVDHALELTAPSGAHYKVIGVLEAPYSTTEAKRGLSGPNVFRDGFAERDDGAGWTAFRLSGKEYRTQIDIPFLFVER